MKMLIVGAGATGGFIGAHLAKAGRDVTFLVRENRATQLKEHGLHVLTPNGAIQLTPQVLTASQIQGPYDVVLLAVKAYALAVALEDMASAIGPTTIILPLLNGMLHMDLIASRFGRQHLFGCACKVATSLDEQGRIVQQGTFFDMSYGELDGSDSTRLARLHDFFDNTQLATKITPTILREMWEKWTLLASLGSINCLMRGSIGEVVATEGGLKFASEILDEVVSLVTAVGEAPSETFVAEARRVLTLEGSPQTSSMYRDLLSGRAIEAQQIIGDLLVRAMKHKLEAPLLNLVYINLQVHQHTSK